MAEPYYKVNNVNMLPYLVEGGLSWEENDIDSDDSGRNMDASMDRTIVARKEKHGMSFRYLKLAESRAVLNALRSEFVTVTTNIHPRLVGVVSFTMYNSSRKGAVYTLDEDGNAVWALDAVSLIER